MRRNLSPTNLLLAATLTLSATPTYALTEMSDDSLSDVQGAGLGFVMDDFSMRWAPTSFIELTGTAPSGASWQRGDARYYGLSITNGDIAGEDWFAAGSGGGCAGSATYGNLVLACPMGIGNNYGITSMAGVYDPFLLRAYQYRGHDYTGNYLQTSADMPTVMELIGPSYTDNWRWAFWGELEVNRSNQLEGAVNNSVAGSGGADFLQSQTIIHGKPTTVADIDGDGNPEPAILRLMRTTGLGATEDTFGITYQSALSGDFRFSVRQKAGSPDLLHRVPDFDDNEGMYFKNVDAFLPLGALHYQAITFDAVRDGLGNATGDFIIELTSIPNIPEIYNHFYCGQISNPNANGCDTNNDGVLDSVNELTRGYVRWGNFENVSITQTLGDNPDTAPVETDARISVLTDPNSNVPGPNAVDNGIYFVSPSATPSVTDVTNIGISRIEGMRIHHLKITTLGAGI